MPSPSNLGVLLGQLAMALLVGVITAYQPGINARFADHTPSKLHGGVANFAVGLVGMLIVTAACRTGLPTTERLGAAPWWAWTGGLCGAFFVTMSLALVPKMGTGNYLVGMIAGQLIGSMVIDHFGHLGLPVHGFTWGRAVGIVLVMAGVCCIKWL